MPNHHILRDNFHHILRDHFNEMNGYLSSKNSSFELGKYMRSKILVTFILFTCWTCAPPNTDKARWESLDEKHCRHKNSPHFKIAFRHWLHLRKTSLVTFLQMLMLCYSYCHKQQMTQQQNHHKVSIVLVNMGPLWKCVFFDKLQNNRTSSLLWW